MDAVVTDNNEQRDDFAKHVDVFFKIDDELSGVSDEVKDLKSSRSTMESRIARHMHENNIAETISPLGKIKLYKSKNSCPINKALVEKAATELLGTEQTTRLLKRIEENRGVVEKIRIKRIRKST